MYPFHNTKTPYIKNITLRVQDMKKSLHFYHQVIGLSIIEESEDQVILGSSHIPLVTLKHATYKKMHTEGLYHIAFLLPTMNDLANWLAYQLKQNTAFIGASDHIVSHAFYLTDPEGNGIEVYADTDPSTWKKKNNTIIMDTLPLDIPSLLKLQTKEWEIGDTILIGHLHLKQKTYRLANRFYQTLGMTTTFEMGSAKFLSFEGYHHHLGMNAWGMQHATPHKQDDVDIEGFTISYPATYTIPLVDAEKTDFTNQTFLTIQDPTGIYVTIERT